MGRRIGVAAVLSSGVLGVPLLLLQNGTPHLPLAASAQGHAESHEVLARHLNDKVLPLHLVKYEVAAAAMTTVPAVTTTTGAPVTTTTVASVTTTTVAPAPEPAVVRPAVVVPVATTTTTAPPAPQPTTAARSEHGQATWYSEAPPGKCASPTLAFGTVLTVTNTTTGATTTCTVDDREAAGYPRVVDLSYSGFSQIADPSQGVVDVTISW
jgi:rare lipoprotein A (peptidoglycan hydrolase)